MLTDHVVYPRCGNPSGHPLTTVVNSIANTIILYTVMNTLASPYVSGIISTLDVLEDCIALTTYGDDNVISINPHVFDGQLADIFTLRTIQKCIKQVFGLDYTDADKTDDHDTHITWDEVFFLKRKFPSQHAYHIHVEQAPLDIRVIEQMIFHFKPTGIRCVDSLNDVLKAAEREACMHGESEYNRIARSINAAITRFPSLTTDNGPCFQVIHQAHLVYRFRHYNTVYNEVDRTPTDELYREYEQAPCLPDGSLPLPPGALYEGL